MAVELQIADGDPWWLSPDVWAVPGDDPNGDPGSPIAGTNAYLWARVSNSGKSGVSNATVRFYWADPSVGFDRNTANLVGTSFVSLDAGESSDVLCLTPWVPEFVNEGHECILAEAFHDSVDPLPVSADFNVPTDRHVAQCNLSVSESKAGKFAMRFKVVNRVRKRRELKLRIVRGRLEEIKSLGARRQIDLRELREGELAWSGISESVCPTEADFRGAARDGVTLMLEPHRSAQRTLVGEVKNGAALLHVEQWCEKKRVGGLSVLVLSK